MIFHRPSQDDPEVWLQKCRNVSGGAVLAGYPLCFDLSSLGDGVRVVKPAADNLGAFVGIAHASVLDGEYLLVQVRGWRKDGAYVLNDIAQAITAGDILIPVAGQWYLARSGAPDGKTGRIHIAEAYATSNPAVSALKRVIL